ncbi:signal peptidase II [soil metagenome]
MAGEDRRQHRRRRVNKVKVWGPLSVLGLTVALLTFGLDQAVKWWMLSVFDIAARQPVSILPVFDLVLAWNEGISYGLFAGGMQWLLILMSVAVSVGLWMWIARTPRPLTASALGLILGGALGNALDRAIHGAVADFFYFHAGSFDWYVFNVADVAIVAGVAALLYESATESRGPRTGHGNARLPGHE